MPLTLSHSIENCCKRGNNLTLIGAMALRGMVGEMTLPGATDGLAFKTYVTHILIPNKKGWSVCSFEVFKFLHLGMISEIPRKSLPAIALISRVAK